MFNQQSSIFVYTASNKLQPPVPKAIKLMMP